MGWVSHISHVPMRCPRSSKFLNRHPLWGTSGCDHFPRCTVGLGSALFIRHLPGEPSPGGGTRRHTRLACRFPHRLVHLPREHLGRGLLELGAVSPSRQRARWLQTATVAKLEREKGFEPSTLCLGSRGSTARVAPPPNDLMLNFFSTLRLAIGGQTLAFAAAQSESCPSTEKERDGAAWPRSTTSSPPT